MFQNSIPFRISKLFLLLFLIIPYRASAFHCGETVTDRAKDTICPGDSALLSVDYYYPFDDFNDGGTNPTMWDSIDGGTVGNSCGSVDGYALYFDGGQEREATTAPLDLTTATRVDFCINIGDGASPCEDAEAGEDVALEYSTDGGSTWTQIQLYDENVYTSWDCISETLPAGAKTNSTILRWTQVSFNGSGFDNWSIDRVGVARSDANLSYAWTPMDSLSAPSSDSTQAYPDTSTLYEVTVTNNNLSCSIKDTVRLGVTDLQVDAWGIDSICAGDSAGLYATSNFSGTSFSWDPSDSLSCSNCANPIAHPDTNRSYVVTASLGNCSDAKDTLDLQVDTLPAVDAGPDTSVCLGDSLRLDGSSPGNPTFSWSPSSSLSDPNVEDPWASPSSSTDYGLTVTDGQGCSNTDSVSLTVNGGSILATTNKDSICPSDSAQLNVLDLFAQDRFDGGVDWNVWSSISEGTVGTECGSMSGDALYFNGSGTRNAVSRSMDAARIDSIAFCLKFGGGSAPCEDAETGEDVVLQYSTDGGATWTNIDNYATTHTTWSCFQVAVPMAAQTSSTLFRWEQSSHSGTDFDNWSLDDVRFIGGGVSATSYSWSPSNGLSSTSVKDPKASPGSGTIYKVDVTDSSGCVSSDSVRIHVTSLSVSAWANTDSICSGDSVSLSASSNLSGTSYSWSPSSKVDCDSCSNTISALSSATDFVLSGTRGACSDDDTVSVGLYPAPNVKASPDTSICFADTIRLDGSGAAFYSWSPGTGLSNPNLEDPEAFPSDSISYVLTATDSNGCTNMDSIDIAVQGGDLLASSDRDSVCPPDSVGLNATIGSFSDDFDQGIYDYYVWSSIDAGAVSSGCGSISGEALRFDGSGTRRAETRTYNTSSCSKMNFCIKFGSGSAPCEKADAGEDVVFEYSTDGGATWTQIDLYQPSSYRSWTCLEVNLPAGAKTKGTRFRWEQVSHNGATYDNWALDDVVLDCSKGNGWTFDWSPSSKVGDPNAQNPTAHFDGKQTYTVTGSVGNCSVSDEVTIHAGGGFDLTTSSKMASCGSNNGAASVDVTGGSTPYSYQWDDPSGQTSDTATNLAAGSYTVTVTDSSGCTKTATVLVQDSGSVFIDSLYASDPRCYGDSSGIASVSAAGGTSPYTYQWDDPDAQTGEKAYGLTAGTYTVTATDQNGCQAVDTVQLDQPDSLSLNTNSKSASCDTCKDGAAWVDVTGGSAPYDHYWDDPSYQNGDTAYGLNPGTYQVTVVDTNGCADSTLVVVGDSTSTTVVGAQKLDDENGMTYYPNPANEHVTIEYELPVKGEARLELRDQMGRLIERSELDARKGRRSIDLDGRAPGIYFVRILQEGQEPMQGKLVIGR